MSSSSKWTAQVWVKWNNTAPDWNAWNWKKEWKEVTWAASTMGEWDMVLWVDVQTPEDLEKFVQKKLWGKKWVSDTHSSWAKEIWSKKAA